MYAYIRVCRYMVFCVYSLQLCVCAVRCRKELTSYKRNTGTEYVCVCIQAYLC